MIQLFVIQLKCPLTMRRSRTYCILYNLPIYMYIYIYIHTSFISLPVCTSTPISWYCFRIFWVCEPINFFLNISCHWNTAKPAYACVMSVSFTQDQGSWILAMTDNEGKESKSGFSWYVLSMRQLKSLKQFPTINSDFCLVYIIHEASKQNVILENHVNCAQTIPGRVSRGRYQQKYI